MADFAICYCCCPQAFKTYQQHITATQSPENQKRLAEAFSALQVDMQRNLEPSNRDRFTQKITTFRHSVRAFLTIN